MKVLHSADYHISTLKPMLGNSLALQRSFNSLKALSRTIKRVSPDVLVIAGDIFDNTYPNSSEVALFTTFITNVHKAGVTILLMPGNHDSEEEAGNTGINYIKPLAKVLKNLHICLKEPLSVEIQDHCFVMFPWGLLPDDYHESLFTLKKRIAVMHIPLHGAKVSADNRQLRNGFSSITAREMVKKFKLRQLLLGDIHEYQALSDEIIYSGSLMQTKFGESEQKGVVLIDTNKRGHSFIDLDVTPKLITIKDPEDADSTNLFRLVLETSDNVFDIINKLPPNVVKYSIPPKKVSGKISKASKKVGFKLELDPIIVKLLEKLSITEPEKYIEFLHDKVTKVPLTLP